MHDLPDSVSLSQLHEQFPIFEIKHARCSARIALHGAQVLSWLPTGAEEVLYLSPDSQYTEGKAIRGGIPICWPWFNAHISDPSLPSHGYARTRFWELVSVFEDEDSIAFHFTTQWAGLSANVKITLGTILEVSLETINLGSTYAFVGGALHSYFRVSDISEISVQGLENCAYLDTVGTRVMRHQEGEIRVKQEIDAIYQSHNPVKIIDADFERVIVIEKSGAASTVVWNPWVAKATTLLDLPDTAYQNFLCVEPAIVGGEAVLLKPDEKHTFNTIIRLEALPSI